VVFKPDRLCNASPFQLNQVEAKRVFQIIDNRIDLTDCPIQPSERAMTCDTDPITGWKEAII